jgi:hypothetical protein
MTLELSDEEAAALARHLRQTLMMPATPSRRVSIRSKRF